MQKKLEAKSNIKSDVQLKKYENEITKICISVETIVTVNDIEMIDYSRNNGHAKETQSFENAESCEIFGIYTENSCNEVHDEHKQKLLFLIFLVKL